MRIALRVALFAMLAAVCAPSPVCAAEVWSPGPNHRQIPIWPDGAPDAQPASGPETLRPGRRTVAGKPWASVTNVSVPTMTVYAPQGHNTGVAVVVFPGGGYKVLAMDLEGTEVCQWLNARGITCVLLKYRVPFSGCHWDETCQCHKTPEALTALQDAQRTMGLVRANAAVFHVDPHKIGVLGFSAGGNLVALVSTRCDRRIYTRVDEADDIGCTPDFAVALYPGHMSMRHKNDPLGDTRLNTDIRVTPETPPTFLLHAQDDETNPVEFSWLYFSALKQARVPVELHVYAEGGHAFGLRDVGLPIANWPRLVETWMTSIGVLVR